MPGYQYSSSPPSTPNRSTNTFSFGATNDPTTTPAGPPPSSAGSFTPAGPPPSSFYGSSNKSFGYSQQSNFGQPELQSPNFSSPIFSRPAPKSQRPVFGNTSRQSQRSLRSPSFDSGEEEPENEDNAYRPGAQSRKRYEDGYSDEDDGMDEDAPYEDEDMDDYRSTSRGPKSNQNVFDQHSNSDRTSAAPGYLRQSKGNQLVDFRGSLGRSQLEKPKPSDFARIAKDFSNAQGVPIVDEGGDLILKTEAIVTRLYEEGVVSTNNEQMLQRALATIPSELTTLWQEYDENLPVYGSSEDPAAIGPDNEGTQDFTKANFLAHLALEIHHSKPVQKGFSSAPKPLPQVMLQWMDDNHDPYPNQLEEITAHRPSPSAHHLFWNTIHNNILRGRVIAVVNCLKSAGWKYAWKGTDEIHDQGGESGYTGVALANVEKVIDDAIKVLALCPAVNGDWNIRGSDWTLFRLRIEQAQEDLKSFAEGANRRDTTFRSEGLGKSSSRYDQSGAYSVLAKKAASQVPWNIYHHLVTLYNIVLGDSVAIIENAQDWCEATIALLVWRDEVKDDRRLAPGRSINSIRASAIGSEPDSDLRRLRRAFHAATGSDTDFFVRTERTVEVGLACLFEGEIEALICLLRCWSLPVAAALAEVASLAGWLPRAEPQALLTLGDEPADQEMMDVLGAFGSEKSESAKDLTLIAYSKGLLAVTDGVVTHNETLKDGWELAIAILGRLDSMEASEQMVEDIVKHIPLDSSNIVDKLWKLLNELGMANKAETVAMKYAQYLAKETKSYGEALWYYALAHDTAMVKDVLDTLITFCLVESTAYPPESELDDHLQRLLTSPKDALDHMSSMDTQAASLVHTSLSGYATLRKFYALRDEEINLMPGIKPSMGPVARKAEAANALLAVIISSDDNIRGGLYDEDRGAVIPVDYILALLGEAMPFVNQPDFLLSTNQIDILLRTIEDIQSVGPRVKNVCSDFLQAVITSAPGLNGSTPNSLLEKSSSSLSGSYSMLGSSLAASRLGRSMAGSGALTKGGIKRGWDWRREIKATMEAKDVANDVLRILRLGLAKDLAKAWLVQADGMM